MKKQKKITTDNNNPITLQQIERVVTRVVNEAVDALALSTKKGFDEVYKKFEVVDKKFEAIDKKFEAIDKKFDIVDERFEKIETKLEGMDNRIIGINGRLDYMAENYVKKVELTG